MRLFIAAIVALAFIAPAVASEPVPSGFLTTYEGFKDGPEGGVAKIWINPKLGSVKGIARYQAFFFDPIVVHLSKEMREHAVSATELATLAKKLHEQLTAQVLAGGYQLAPAPGPGVLRFIIALTDVEPSNPTMDKISSVVPMARVFSFIKKEVTGQHSFVGSASVEGVVVDGATNETMIAFTDKRSGDKGVFKDTGSMKDVNEAFKYWSKRLRLVLDQAFGKAPAQ